jgi:branched-chain amino acid transport system ATP-binding protein
MSRPKLLLLDEPSLGLAPRHVQVIAETIRNNSGEGVPVLLVEQNAAMALSLARSAYVLELGRVVLRGAADELAGSDEVRRLYLGESADESAREAAPAPALSRWGG